MTDYERTLAEENGVYTIRQISRPINKMFVDYTPEPKRKVSPYAKFDRFHHKKKKRK